MFKKNFQIIAFVFFSLALILPAQYANAASSSFVLSSGQVRVGDIFIAELKLEDISQKINAMDGLIIFDPAFLQVKDVSTGDSVFQLWPRTPDFSSIEGKIMFTGGVPSGTMGGSIVKIAFLAKKAGQANFYLSDDSALYLNDGKGTKTSAQNQKVALTVLESDASMPTQNIWQESLSGDKFAPKNLIIQLGSDPYTFDGKYFISFFAEDKESGIDHYEVKEGDKDFVTTASPYVLTDQSLKSKIFVKAVDKAGNEKIKEFKQSKAFYLQPWFIALILVLIVYFIWRKKKSSPQAVAK